MQSGPLKEVILQSQLKPSHCCKHTPWLEHESSWQVVLGPTKKNPKKPWILIKNPKVYYAWARSHIVVANTSDYMAKLMKVLVHTPKLEIEKP